MVHLYEMQLKDYSIFTIMIRYLTFSPILYLKCDMKYDVLS